MENLFITCIQCGKEFEFSVDEQKRYKKMGFDDPVRCQDCRKRKTRMAADLYKKHNHKKKSFRFRYEDDY